MAVGATGGYDRQYQKGVSYLSPPLPTSHALPHTTPQTRLCTCWNCFEAGKKSKIHPAWLFQGVFIRHQGSENSPFTTQKVLANVQQPMKSFIQTWSLFSQYFLVTLHLFLAARILTENPVGLDIAKGELS